MKKYNHYVPKQRLDELHKGSSVYVVADILTDIATALSVNATCVSIEEKLWGGKKTRTLHFRIEEQDVLKFDWIGSRKTPEFEVKIEIDITDPDFPRLITKDDASEYGAVPSRSTFGYTIYYMTTDEEELDSYLAIYNITDEENENIL